MAFAETRHDVTRDFTALEREAVATACRWHRQRPGVGPGVPAHPGVLHDVEDKLREDVLLSDSELVAAAIAVVAYTDQAGRLVPADYSADRVLLEDAQDLEPLIPDSDIARQLAGARVELVAVARHLRCGS